MVDMPPEEEIAPDSEDSLLAIEERIARRAPYDEIVAALDALEVPEDALAIASVAHTRLSATSIYQRPEGEVAAAIERYLAAERTPWRRLSATLAACVDAPELFRRYVDPLIAESETIEAPEEPLGKVLEAARRARRRVLGAKSEP